MRLFRSGVRPPATVAATVAAMSAGASVPGTSVSGVSEPGTATARNEATPAAAAAPKPVGKHLSQVINAPHLLRQGAGVDAIWG